MASRMEGIDACPLSTLIHDTAHQICLGADAVPFDIELRRRNSFQKRLEPKRSEAWDFKQKKNLCSNPTTLFHRTTISRKKKHNLSPEPKRLLKTWTFHLCRHLPGCRTLPWARYAPLRRPGLRQNLFNLGITQPLILAGHQIILDWKFLNVLRAISIIGFQMNSPLSPWLEAFHPLSRLRDGYDFGRVCCRRFHSWDFWHSKAIFETTTWMRRKWKL